MPCIRSKMVRFYRRLKKWGNSKGIVIPLEISKHFEIGEEVIVEIYKRDEQQEFVEVVKSFLKDNKLDKIEVELDKEVE